MLSRVFLAGLVAATAVTSALAQDTAEHPVGGYLPQPGNAIHLLPPGDFGGWQEAAGYPLYVMDRECRGQCAVMFPPLTPRSANDPKPSDDWSIRTRIENGAYQWVYKGQPVYTYYQDSPDAPPQADSVIPGITLARP